MFKSHLTMGIVVLASALSLAACDEGTYYTGVGYGGIDASVSTVGYPYRGTYDYGSYYSSYPRYTYPRTYSYSHYYRDYRGHRRHDYNRRDRRDDDRRDHRGDHGRGRGHGRDRHREATTVLGSDFSVSFPELFAEKFSLSASSATKLLDAFEEAQKGRPAGLNSLGLSSPDVQRMTRFELPSEASVDRMAEKLDQDPRATRAMLKTLLATGEKRLNARCAQGDLPERLAEVCAHR